MQGIALKLKSYKSFKPMDNVLPIFIRRGSLKIHIKVLPGGFRQILFISKGFGLLPWDFITKYSEHCLNSNNRCRHAVCSKAYSTFLSMYSLLHFIYYMWILGDQFPSNYPKSSLPKQLELIQAPIFNFSIFLIRFHFLKNFRKLENILKNWNFFGISNQSVASRKCRVSGFGTIVVAAVLSSSILENLLYDVQHFTDSGKLDDNTTVLEKYYRRNRSIVTSFLPFSPFLSVFTTLMSKVSTYVWNMSDIIVIILSRGLTNRFLTFNEYLKIRCCTCILLVRDYYAEQIRLEFQQLCQHAEDIASFLSPLLTISFCYNMCFLMLNIYRWLDPRWIGQQERAAYVIVAFLQISLRVILVTYYVSNIHHSTAAIEKTLELVPDQIYSQSLERFERQVSKYPIGVSVLGIRVTRRFFISIVSFLFTAEIVLLQSARPYQ